MFAAGIVDPDKVTRTALQNAASVAGLLLTTEARRSPNLPRRKKPAGHQDPHHGGGMGGWEAWAEWEAWVAWEIWG